MLSDFLQTKELFYKDIDYNYMPNLWKKISSKFKIPKIIHIIGTNGKGSTGRFFAYYLYKSGYNVGHYSSPHILSFNERVWINGKDSDDNLLELAHQNLKKKLAKEDLQKLSYFEYTTLLAIEVFSKCDFVILEAGLGGEYDATNIFPKLFTLVTPIDIDHKDFLGNSIEDIATTKLRSINTFAIFTEQKKIVYEVANRLNIKYYLSYDILTNDQKKQIKRFIEDRFFASYLMDNLSLAMAGVIKLGIDFDINRLNGVKLKGRFEKVSKNIIIDVGHNLLAAKAIKKELKDRKVTLIYNSYKDKDYKEILKLLKPNIKKVLILDIKNDRIIPKKKLKKVLHDLKIPYQDYKNELLKDYEDYLVFGSFVSVEKFLNEYKKDI